VAALTFLEEDTVFPLKHKMFHQNSQHFFIFSCENEMNAILYINKTGCQWQMEATEEIWLIGSRRNSNGY